MTLKQLVMVESLTDAINGLCLEVQKKIISNNDWIYYFVNPFLKPTENEALYTVLRQHPKDWADYVGLDVIGLEHSGATVTIAIDDGSEEGVRLRRHIALPIFQLTIDRNKKVYAKGLLDYEIEGWTETVENLEKSLENAKRKLAELKKEKEEQS